MADQLPGAGQIFYADALFEADGVKFLGLARPGVARVETPDGEVAEFDANEFARENGMAGADVQFNTPATALQNQTPVSVLDRLKLSFGNAKGGVQYLKNNYQNATVGEDGQLLVQKDGVWTGIDPEGISGPDGWSFAEVIGDMADISRDILLGGAQIAGGIAGGAGTMGAGAAAGATAASAVASTATAALGRILGTHEATPTELLQEVAIDTALAAAGEGVALGAQKMILPAIKNMWKKGASLGDEAGAIMDDFISTTTGISPEASMTARSQFDNVGAVLDDLNVAARSPKALLSDAPAPGVAPSSFTAVRNAADNMMASTMKEIVEQAPARLSRNFETAINRAYASVDAATPVPTQAMQAFTDAMSEFSKMELFKMQARGNQPALARPKTVAELMQTGMTGAEAQAVLQGTKDIIQNYNKLVGGSAQALKGPEAMKQLASMVRMSDDLVGRLTRGESGLVADAYQNIATKLANSVTESMPASVRSGYAAARQEYAQNIGFVEKIKGMREGPGKNWGTAALELAKQYQNKAKGDPSATIMFQSLGRLDSKFQEALNKAQVINAAAEWRTVGSEGMWAPLQGAQRAVRRGAFGAAQGVRGLGKLAAQAVRPVTYPMSAVAKSLRGLAQPAINDPQTLAAALTAAMQGMRQ